MMIIYLIFLVVQMSIFGVEKGFWEHEHDCRKKIADSVYSGSDFPLSKIQKGYEAKIALELQKRWLQKGQYGIRDAVLYHDCDGAGKMRSVEWSLGQGSHFMKHWFFEDKIGDFWLDGQKDPSDIKTMLFLKGGGIHSGNPSHEERILIVASDHEEMINPWNDLPGYFAVNPSPKIYDHAISMSADKKVLTLVRPYKNGTQSELLVYGRDVVGHPWKKSHSRTVQNSMFLVARYYAQINAVALLDQKFSTSFFSVKI